MSSGTGRTWSVHRGFDKALGESVASLDICAESDSIYYDSARRLIFVSCGTGSLDVIRQTAADHYELADRIPTAKGASTSLFAQDLDRLFLAVPRSDQEPAAIRVYQPVQ